MKFKDFLVGIWSLFDSVLNIEMDFFEYTVTGWQVLIGILFLNIGIGFIHKSVSGGDDTV